MPPALVFRSSSARVYAIVAWVVAGIAVVAFATNGGMTEALAYGALPATLAVAAWVAFWRPQMRVQKDGVQVVNLLSTTWLPWAAITGTKTRWGLELVTTRGTVGVWAMPARGSLSRLRHNDRPAPPVPFLPTVDSAPGGSDVDVAAEFIEEHATGVSDLSSDTTTGPVPQRRFDPLPCGLLLVSVALSLVTVLS